jgi:disulfide bond formation protein DsbB
LNGLALSALAARWPLAALIVSGALLAGAHAFETFGGLAPCPMCLSQREWHWGIAAMAALALLVVSRRPQEARWAAFALGLAYLGSFAMAASHVGVEQHWLPALCETSGAGGSLVFDINAKLDVPRCDAASWMLFGVTMAGYNALISAAMALASLTIAFAAERT